MTRPSWQSLKRSMTGDTSLIVGAMVFQNLLRIVSSVTLTRLLTAEAFAIVAIITSILVTIGFVSDIGVSAFLVRHERTDDPDFRNEVWTLRLIRGATLTLVTALISFPVAHFIGKPTLAPVIALASLTFILDGLSSLAPFMALRNRRLRKLTVIESGSQIAALALSIVMAMWLKSYWAIIVTNMFTQLAAAGLSYALYSDSGHRWRFSRERSKELWKFSRFITGSTIITLIITQSDKLVLTRVFTLETLGLYVIAVSLAAVPLTLASAFSSRVSYPLLAQIRRDAPETMAHRFYHHRILPTLLYTFATGGLIGVAPTLITILYDPRYFAAAHFLQILAISSIFAFGTQLANEVMIALGHPKYSFSVNIVRLSYLVVSGAAGWHVLGPTGVVLAVGTVEFAAQLFGWYTLKRHGLLNVWWEAVFLAAGLTGCGVGYAVDIFARTVLGIR